MRRSSAVLIVLACCAASGAVVAQTRPAPQRVAARQPVPLDSSTRLTPLVVVELLARKVAPNQDPVESAWLGHLISFYAAPQVKTLWVDDRGWRPSAGIALDELLRADDFALDPSRLGIPSSSRDQSEVSALVKFEVALSLAVVRYAWHARGGRLDPTQLSLWLDYKPRPVNAAEILRKVVAAVDPASGLRALHPSHIQFETLRRAYLSAQGRTASTASSVPSVSIPMGVRIKPGRRHPDVALARLRLGKHAADGDETLLDSDFQNDLYDFMNNAARIHYGRGRGIDDDVRVALNGGKRAPSRDMVELIRANIERWRWLPPDLGELYVWNNLPEFETRVVKNGQIIHSEKIIIGQPDTQTPVFSDEILRVIFNPDWNVPESIKLSSIWSSLRGGDYGVLRRRNMRIVHEGKEINPAKLKYAELNARDVPVVMGPGPGNPLGRFKFVFPNKHDVYMHDTTSKGLFASRERTFSHGCIRVKDPQRFAEVMLAEGKGWNRGDVSWQARAKGTVRIELDRKIPVHNTYFTLVADATGNLKKLSDIYGHDKRITDAMNGVDAVIIAASDPALALKKKNEDLANGAVVLPAMPKPIAARPKPKMVAARPVPASTFTFKPAPPPRPNYLGRQSSRSARPRPKGFFFLW